MIRKYRKSFALCLKATSLVVSLSSGYGRALAGSYYGSGGSYHCLGATAPGDTTLTLSGNPLTVTTLPGFGIDATTSGGDAFDLSSFVGITFTDFNRSTITGAEDGIVATNYGNLGLSITTNGGTVKGTSGIGIWTDNRSSGTDLTISAATVTGGDDGINATNSGTGHLRITTSGPVEGTADQGIVATNYGTDLTITATEVSGGTHGIVATNHGSTGLSITATGAVSGENSGMGIWANNYGTDLTISAASVFGGDKGIYATNFGNGHLRITASGPVTGISAHGIIATNHGNSDLSITTMDTVTGGTDDMGIWANNYGTDLIIATAEVSGGDKGILATNSGAGHLWITASGPVTSTGAWGMGIYASNSPNGTDLNIAAADVTGGDVGIFAINQGRGALSITTSGSVTGASSGIIALSYSGQPTTINVFGRISNRSGSPTDHAIIAIGAPTTVNFFAGSTTTGIIDLTDGNDTVNLAGTLNGSIEFNDGNDTFIQVGGSSLSGTVDGGNGIDTLGFDNMGTVNNSVIGGTYLNFENLGIYGGTTTLTGAWDFSGGDSTVYAGNLFLAGSLNTNTFTVNSGYANISGVLNSRAVFVGGRMDLGGTVNSDFFTVARGGFAGIPGTLNSETATVYGGMNLNGNLTADTLTVASGGMLSGSGQVNGRFVNYGTISPGNSIGTLSVNGSAGFMPGSRYLVELSPIGAGDRIDVGGPVNIDGGTVQTSLPRSLYTNGENWKIISASGGVRGSFEALAYNRTSQTVELRLAYGSQQVMLEIVRTPFSSFGLTPAEQAVGAGLDNVVPLATGSMVGLITAMDFDMSRPQIENTLNALSPEMYTSFSAAGLQSAEAFDQAVDLHQSEFRQDRILGLSSPTDQNEIRHGEWTVWTRGVGIWSERDSGDKYMGYSQNIGGVAAGTDRQFSEGVRAGLALAYTDSDLDWDGTSHSGSMQGRHLGMYAGVDPGNFFIDASLGYSDFADEADRAIAIDGYSAEAHSSFDANVWAGRLEGGYDFTFSHWLLSPVASLNYAHLAQDGLSEHGANFLSLDVAATDTDSISSSVGLRFSGLIERKQWQYLPRLDVRWQHQFEDEGASVTANFVNYESASFDVTGIAPVADQGILTLGLSGEYGKNLSLYVDYGVAIADGYTSQLVSGGLSWRF